MLKKGSIIQFIHICNFTGNKTKIKGEIIGYAKEVRAMWPVECGEIVNPVYLVKEEDLFGNFYNHVIYPEEIFFEDKFKQVRIMQTHKTKIRTEKEKKRREYYFK